MSLAPTDSPHRTSSTAVIIASRVESQPTTARRGVPSGDGLQVSWSPQGNRLLISDEHWARLYGIGSASDFFRPGTIPPAVEVLTQGLLGRDPDEIEDIWQSSYMSSLWRNNLVNSSSLSPSPTLARIVLMASSKCSLGLGAMSAAHWVPQAAQQL